MPSRTRTLTWNTQTDSDLAGWKIYSGTASSGAFSRVITAGLTTSTGSPTYILDDLRNGKTYWVALTAYDLTGNESTFGTFQSTGPISFEVTAIRRTYA